MEFQPAEMMLIRDVETLKVLADERRLRILEVAMQRPCTVKQVAAELDTPPTKLYYHIKQMEEHGLLVVVDTQVVSGIIEKTYRAAAERFQLDDTMLPLDEEALQKTVDIAFNVFDRNKAALRKSHEAGHFGQDSAEEAAGAVFEFHFVLSREQARALQAEADELFKHYAELSKDNKGPGHQHYHLMLAFFQSPDQPEPAGDEEEQNNTP